MSKQVDKHQKALLAAKRTALCVRSKPSLNVPVQKPSLAQEIRREVDGAKKAVTHIHRHHQDTQGWIALFQKLDVKELSSWTNQLFVRMSPVYEQMILRSAYALTKAQQKRLEALPDDGKEQYLIDKWAKKARDRLEKVRLDGGSKLVIQPVKPSRQYSYQLTEITEDLLLDWGMNDLYFVQNPSYIQGRRTEKTVKEFRALYVDLDIRELTSMTVEQAWDEVRKLFGVTVPYPNVVAFSGAGIHLVWWLIPVSHFKGELWHKIENRLVDIFRPFGVDIAVSDVVRVLRPDGSYNCKRGKTTEVLYLQEDRYDLRQFAELIMPDWIPYQQWLEQHESLSQKRDRGRPSDEHSNVVPFTKPSQKSGKRKNATKTMKQSIQTQSQSENIVASFVPRAIQRLQDLETLRKMGALDEDRRRRAVFLYRVTALSAYPTEEALEMTYAFNERLRTPLDYDVEWETRNAEVKRYRYSTEKIVDWLEITPQEQSCLQVLRLDSASKSARKPPGMTREEYTSTAKERWQRIAELKTQGLSNRRIADMLGCSEGEVRRLLKTHASNQREVLVAEEGVRRVVPIWDKALMWRSCECDVCEGVRRTVSEAARWWSSSPLPDDYTLLSIDEDAFTFARGTGNCDPAATFLLSGYLPPEAPIVCKRYVIAKMSDTPTHQWKMEPVRDLFLSVLARFTVDLGDEHIAG